jgi:hypothetical protein
MEMKNKKAWIKILESFIAVIIIFIVLTTIIVKQKSNADSEDEITKLQSSIIEVISRDESIRSEILIGKKEGVYNKISLYTPEWMNYSVTICKSDQICPLEDESPILQKKEIYSSEALVLSNITEFEDKKVKIFFWRK